MTIHFNEADLGKHLRGHSVPRVYTELVREALGLFQDQPTVNAYNALPQLRELLNNLADDPQLSVKQKLVIRKAYLILKGDSSVLSAQLEKDLQAITSSEPLSTNDAWPFIMKGFESISVPYWYKAKPIDVFTRHYRLVHARKKVDMNAFRLTAGQVYKDLIRWASMPMELRRFSDWKFVFPGVDLDQIPSGPPSNVVGSVGFTQEPGFKLRLFASPYQYIQSFLKPVKDFLQRSLSTLDEDCHLNQERGRVAVQQQLRDGNEVYCFDLSSATHLFPWSLQQKVLRKFGIPHEYMAVLNWAVKGDYSSSQGTISWNVGQPLGLFPSFFAFSLTHHLLIRGIFTRLGLNPNGGYVLLGDDVAIFNKKVAKVYVKMMDRIGCKINLGKSIISDTVGEFAGAFIDRRNIINIGKLRSVTDKNILSVNRQFSTVEPRMKEAVDYLNGKLDVNHTTYVSLVTKLKVIQRIRTSPGLTPDYVINHVRNFLSRFHHIPILPGPYEACSVALHQIKFCEWLDKVYSQCPQCWPGSYVPYKVGIAKIQTGIVELLQSAVDDGYSVPLWWNQYCDYAGLDPCLYSHFRVIRLILNEWASLIISPVKAPFTEGKFYRIIKRALRKARTMEDTELISAINNLNAQLCSDYPVLGKSDCTVTTLGSVLTV